MRLARLEKTSDAKVNQKDVPTFADHHIGRFEVTKNDWWLMIMEITQYVTQLLCPIHHLLHWQRVVSRVFQVLFQRFAIDEIHDQV